MYFLVFYLRFIVFCSIFGFIVQFKWNEAIYKQMLKQKKIHEILFCRKRNTVLQFNNIRDTWLYVFLVVAKHIYFTKYIEMPTWKVSLLYQLKVLTYIPTFYLPSFKRFHLAWSRIFIYFNSLKAFSTTSTEFLCNITDTTHEKNMNVKNMNVVLSK